ncbi:zinc finger A20 and AN1 domain-containing stress-associated protein 1 [Typha angustifolia]|uniref:zinc finger A20 and AN1 domain-containing stress-associated protein 1 n=1 Tax=Typha angustifolia TaxID=59011 RepID=UPI003C30A95F
MAQRDKKEETELQLSENLTLCVNNCGFYGNPATNNMCQSCFQSSAAAASSLSSPSSSSSPLSFCQKTRSAPDRPPVAAAKEAVTSAAEAPAPASRVNRCYSCRKRVGLTGFRCRCGDLFCGEHRYSDRHLCSFDYKAAAREAIARENPVVRAAKIVRM